ncbi:MAG: TVP38/TMEM64 family protein [Patescibacteria group bacterium]
MNKNLLKIFVGIILITAIVLAYSFDLAQFLNLGFIQTNRDLLTNYVRNNYVLAAAIHMFVYVINVSLSLPFSALLTLTGGFLFGLYGVFFNLIGATIGASIVFILSRYLFGESLQKKYQKQLKTINQNIEQNGVSYLLFTRLSPIFPFFVINALCGLTKIKLKTFVWTTALGIIPGTFVYTYLGRSLTEVNSIQDLLSPQIFLALFAISLFSFVPMIIKKINARDV